MSVLNKHICLVLNNLWLPIGYNSVRKGVVAMLSESNGNIAAKAIDIKLNKDADGEWDYYNPEYLNPVSWEEWVELDVPEYYPTIQLTHNRVIRAPVVVLACNCSKITTRELKPTKKNIFEWYNYRCIYSNKVLPKNQLNIEHVHAKDKGGKDTWGNLAPCDKNLNFKKGNKTVEEMGYKLQYPLTAPKPVPFVSLITEPRHPLWLSFIMKKK